MIVGFRALFALAAALALWTVWLYLNGDTSGWELLFRVFFAVALSPWLRAPRTPTVKANDEALILPGVFRPGGFRGTASWTCNWTLPSPGRVRSCQRRVMARSGRCRSSRTTRASSATGARLRRVGATGDGSST